MARQEIHEEKYTRVSNAVAAGQTTVNATHVDMQGFESCVFAVLFGAIVAGAACTVKVQTGDESDDSDMADYGSAVTVADTDDNTVVLVEVVKPLKRYVRCVVTRATQNVTVDGILAWQYDTRHMPPTQDTSISHTNIIFEPAAS